MKTKSPNTQDQLPFTTNFVVDIALGFEEPDIVCENHGVTPEEYERLLDYEPFVQARDRMAADFKRNGVTLELKARLSLEVLLADAIQIAHEPTNDAKDRLQAMQLIQKIANLDKTDTSSVAPPSIYMDFSGTTPSARSTEPEISQ